MNTGGTSDDSAARSSEEVEVHVLLLFLLDDCLLLFLGGASTACCCAASCCRCSRSTAAATSAEALELFLARCDDLMDGLALELGHELLGDACVVLGVNRLENLLDVLRGWAVVATQHGHQVGTAIFHRHGMEIGKIVLAS